MVPLLFLSTGLRNKDDNERNRKREKRNEIQCILEDCHWSLFKICFKLVFFMNLKKIYDHNVGKFRTYFFIKNNYA